MNQKGTILKGNTVWSVGLKQTSKAKAGYLSKLRNKFLKLVPLTWFTINMGKKRTSTFGPCKWTRNYREVACEVSLHVYTQDVVLIAIIYVKNIFLE